MFAVLDLVSRAEAGTPAQISEQSFWLEREPSLIQEHALYRQGILLSCPLAQSRMENHGAREALTPGAQDQVETSFFQGWPDPSALGGPLLPRQSQWSLSCSSLSCLDLLGLSYICLAFDSCRVFIALLPDEKLLKAGFPVPFMDPGTGLGIYVYILRYLLGWMDGYGWMDGWMGG